VTQGFVSASQGAGWQHGFIETNQVRLHYVTQGKGELVILLHGFFEFWYSWRHQIPALARLYKVVVPDLRGYNDSDKPTTGHDLATLSQDVVGLIKGLGYPNAHIIGHGWGGTVAWHLAQSCPEQLQKLVVLSGVHPHQWQQALLSNLGAIRQSWPLLAAQLPSLPEWMLHSWVPTLITNLFQSQAIRKGAFSPQDTQLYRAALQKPGAIAAAIQQYQQAFGLQTWLRPAFSNQRIQAPTLLLWGEDDTLFPAVLNNGIEQHMVAPLEVQKIPHCGHWIQQEVPLTVNRSLLRFLSL
jgi:pimeloyl-ACP methyl ester carboxylesterase